MTHLLKEFEREILTKKVFALLLLFFTTIMFAPLLYIGKFNHLAADCFWYGANGRNVWANERSIFAVLGAAVKNVVDFWHDWQGTYSSIFMFSLTPGLFGEQYMFIVPYMMMGMILLSTFVLLYVFFIKIIGTELSNFFIFFFTASFMQIQFLYTPNSALYWYNGAVHYVFMQGFVIMNIAILMQYFNVILDQRSVKEKNYQDAILLAIASLFGLIASGANFSSTLLNIEIFTIALLVAVYIFFKLKIKKVLYILVPYFLTLTGFLFNTFAPGNANRQVHFERTGIFESILTSFTYSFSQMLLWVDVFVVVCLLILIPFMIKIIYRSNFKFPFAPAIAVLSYCLYASMFTPSFYAQSFVPLSRNQNICWMFLIILLIINEFYLLGWILGKINKNKWKWLVPSFGINKWCWFAYITVLAAIFTFSFLSLGYVEKKATFVSYAAWDVIETGVGRQYHDEYLRRLYQLKKEIPEGEDRYVYVYPYTVKPYPLYFRDATEESTREDGMLEGIEGWYNVWAVFEIRE